MGAVISNAAVPPATPRAPWTLTRAALPADTTALARFLLGKVLVRPFGDAVTSGRIVETEAYPPGDAASHAYRGRTTRNAAMFLQPGHAYVYLAYGLAMMMNVSSEAEGTGGGVLIRALEPLSGIALMEMHRGLTRLRDLARGPGRLAQALAIDRRLDSVDLCVAGSLWLGDDGTELGTAGIGASTRIGLTKDADRVLRFFVRGSPFVSGPAALNR